MLTARDRLALAVTLLALLLQLAACAGCGWVVVDEMHRPH